MEAKLNHLYFMSKITRQQAAGANCSAMEQRPFSITERSRSKKRVSPKNHRSRNHFLMSIAVFVLFSSYCYGQVNIQQQQQNVNINLPVIEKTVYVDRYRTVYVDRPQPKRVARKLPQPVQLLGYLWVYTEDLGNFKRPPFDVIRNINTQAPYGRDDWRIPTPEELAVMEANADKVGLGDDIYLATDHSNGVLRLVSTGKSVAEQNAERRAVENRLAAERQRAAEQQRIAENNTRTKGGVLINGVVWATRNVGSKKTFVSNNYDCGIRYSTKTNNLDEICPKGWRLPTRAEIDKLLQSNNHWTSVNDIKGRMFGSGENTIFLPACGMFWQGYEQAAGKSGHYLYEGKYNLAYFSFYKDEVLFNSNPYSEDYASVRCVLDE